MDTGAAAGSSEQQAIRLSNDEDMQDHDSEEIQHDHHAEDEHVRQHPKRKRPDQDGDFSDAMDSNAPSATWAVKTSTSTSFSGTAASTTKDNYDLLQHRDLRVITARRRIKLVRDKPNNNTVAELIRLLRADDAKQQGGSSESGSEAITPSGAREVASETPPRSRRPKKKQKQSRAASDDEAEEEPSMTYVPKTAASKKAWAKIMEAEEERRANKKLHQEETMAGGSTQAQQDATEATPAPTAAMEGTSKTGQEKTPPRAKTQASLPKKTSAMARLLEASGPFAARYGGFKD